MVLANQNAKLTGPDQGFLVSPIVLMRKPWERGWLSTFVENFEYTIKKYENSIFQFIGKRLTNGQTETLKIRFGQCFNMIGPLLHNS
jgi:hypothetical protein